MGPLRGNLSPVKGRSPQEEWCFAHSGIVSAILVEFLLARLEEIDDAVDPGVFSAVTGALARLPSDAVVCVVQDIERKFPVNAPDSRPEIRIIHEWGMEEYGRLIATRLRAIMAREHEPKAVPFILQTWSIPPEKTSMPLS